MENINNNEGNELTNKVGKVDENKKYIRCVRYRGESNCVSA